MTNGERSLFYGFEDRDEPQAKVLLPKWWYSLCLSTKRGSEITAEYIPLLFLFAWLVLGFVALVLWLHAIG